MGNINLTANNIALFFSPRDKQYISAIPIASKFQQSAIIYLREIMKMPGANLMGICCWI
jgi:hypothetical protein